MSRRDDRPRERAPKKPKPADGEAPRTCSECGFVFSDEALSRGAKYRVRKDGTVACRDDRTCRTRQLTLALGHELGSAPPEDWLFFRYPRDLVYRAMDVRPKNWKALGWLPRSPLPDRCMACVLYHSWCYPVSLPYAVQLAGTLPHPARRDFDDDEILTDMYKLPVPLREKDIALILNEHQSSVSRALKRLIETKQLRVDESGVFYPAAKLADLSVAERQALYRPDRLASDPDDEMRGVPKRFRKDLVLIEQHVDPDISSAIFDDVLGFCSTFNDVLRDGRTARDTGIKQACARGLSLLPEGLDPSRRRPSSSPRAAINAHPVMNGGPAVPSSESAQAPVRTPSIEEPASSVDRSTDGQPLDAQAADAPTPATTPEASLDETTWQKAGKGAFYKLPRPRPRPRAHAASLPESPALSPLAAKLRAWMEAKLPVPVPLEESVFQEVNATIGSENHLEQFQKAALQQKNPRGWKVYVKIALKCQEHHEKYREASAGGEEESYIERRYREEIEARARNGRPSDG